MLEGLYKVCTELIGEFESIDLNRRAQLEKLSAYLSDRYRHGITPKLIVICTHNSRRSHMGQLWLAAAAEYYQLPEIGTYSGGTEATAFNQRAVKAIQKIGFSVSLEDGSVDNPVYQIAWKKDKEPYPAFSKKYDASSNPLEKFGAIMVCTEADHGCPMVQGCDFRLALPFEDPKAYDDTDLADQMYLERAKQIGKEMLFVMSQVELE